MKNYKKNRVLYLIPATILVFIVFINTVGASSVLAHGSFGRFLRFSNYKNFHIDNFKNYFKHDDDHYDDDENDDDHDHEKEHHKSHDEKLDCGFGGGEIFEVENMLPGDSEEREMSIKNNTDFAVIPVLKGFRTGPDGEFDPLFETVLDFSIFENSILVYSNKLQGFFDDSDDFDKVELTQISSNETKDLKLRVYFPESSGNEYMLKKVVFKLECDKGVVVASTPSPKPTPTTRKHSEDRH